MRGSMEHFLIYTNPHKDEGLATTGHIGDYLRARGKRVTVRTDETGWRDSGAGHGTKDIPHGADCMVVLGGDGTMLQAAREARRLNVPMIGVNLGTLGYMTEVEPEGLDEALDRLIAGDYQRESRMMLKGTAFLPENAAEDGWALNDIVISRSGSLQIIKFNIYVNGRFLHDYDADGVIVTTPTGSTGYNLSAGGPLVEPNAELIMVTPICPHTLNQRSIILSPEDVVEIEILPGREDRVQTVEVNFDGSHVISLGAGDRVRVVKAQKSTEFIRLSKVSFLEVLHKKMAD